MEVLAVVGIIVVFVIVKVLRTPVYKQRTIRETTLALIADADGDPTTRQLIHEIVARHRGSPMGDVRGPLPEFDLIAGAVKASQTDRKLFAQISRAAARHIDMTKPSVGGRA